MGQVLQTAEVAVAAGGFGYANARYGKMVGSNPTPEIDLFGVPADIGLAAALHLGGFSGSLGKYKEHAHNLGDGCLASYLTRVGLRMGVAAKQKAAAPPSTAGAFGQGNPSWSSSSYQPHAHGNWPGVG